MKDKKSDIGHMMLPGHILKKPVRQKAIFSDSAFEMKVDDKKPEFTELERKLSKRELREQRRQNYDSPSE